MKYINLIKENFKTSYSDKDKQKFKNFVKLPMNSKIYGFS